MLCQVRRGYPATVPAQFKASFRSKVSNLYGCVDILPNVNQYSVVFLSLQTDKNSDTKTCELLPSSHSEAHVESQLPNRFKSI